MLSQMRALFDFPLVPRVYHPEDSMPAGVVIHPAEKWIIGPAWDAVKLDTPRSLRWGSIRYPWIQFPLHLPYLATRSMSHVAL